MDRLTPFANFNVLQVRSFYDISTKAIEVEISEVLGLLTTNPSRKILRRHLKTSFPVIAIALF